MNYTQAYKWLRAQGVEPAEARAALDVAAEPGQGSATAWYGPRAANGQRAGWRVTYTEGGGYAQAGRVDQTPPAETTEPSPRRECPDCGSTDLDAPDVQGWQYCNACGSDFSPDYVPGMDDDVSRNYQW